MSLTIVNAVDLRATFGGTPNITVICSQRLNTDLNARRPIIMLSDNTYLYGLYVDATGTDIMLNDPFNFDPAGAVTGASLVVGSFVSVGITRTSARLFTPYVNGTGYTAFTPPSTPQADPTSAWFGCDSVSYNDVSVDYIMIVPQVLTATEMTTAMASATPWDAWTNAIVYGPLTGTDRTTALATISVRGTGNLNGGVATWSANERTFGSTLTGTDTLDIA